MAESPVEKDLGIANIMGEKIDIIGPVNSPSLDFNDNEDIPTELSDSSDTHDEGMWGKALLSGGFQRYPILTREEMEW